MKLCNNRHRTILISCSKGNIMPLVSLGHFRRRGTSGVPSGGDPAAEPRQGRSRDITPTLQRKKFSPLGTNERSKYHRNPTSAYDTTPFVIRLGRCPQWPHRGSKANCQRQDFPFGETFSPEYSAHRKKQKLTIRCGWEEESGHRH